MDGQNLEPSLKPGVTQPIPVIPRRPRVSSRVAARAIMWSLPFLAAGLAIFFWMTSGRFIETDNAYVKGDRVYLATEISGPIVEVLVHENQHVSRGQLLYKIDDTPSRIALAKIESEIDIQRSEIRGLRAQWRTKREEIKSALSQQVFAQQEFERQKDLAERKFAPTAKLEETRISQKQHPGAAKRRQKCSDLIWGSTRSISNHSSLPKLRPGCEWTRESASQLCDPKWLQWS